VRSLLDGIEHGGATLVVRGEPGIGKSRLLAEAAALARERAFKVLSAAGVQSEAHLAFAGLHQLIRPIRSRIADLPVAQRAALDAAFGLSEESAPERFRIALAVLDLLSDVATDEPLLVVAEDAHWLDSATAEVLAFVARRVESDPIVVLVAARDGYASPLIAAGLPEYRLGGLEATAAAQLLRVSAQSLSRPKRARILREADGNPLALIELPLTASQTDQWATGALPLTERLERAFAARVSELPAETTLLLQVAALNDGQAVGEILEAAGAVAGRTVGLDLLEPAEQAALVVLDMHAVRFRHPLIRSAVRQGASVPQLRSIHEALAEVLREDPDRRVWHRAALIDGTHEDIANELEVAARRARQRGAIAVATTALQRAAELSPPGQRARRLVEAALLAFESGQFDLVKPMLRDVAGLDPSPLDRARATWIEEIVSTRPLGEAAHVRTLLGAAARAGEAGDRDLQIDLVWLVATRAWLVTPTAEVQRMLTDAADRLGEPGSAEPRVVAIHAYADPLGKAPAILARLRAAVADRDLSTESARLLGSAAVVVGAFDIAALFLATAVEGLRMEGRLGHLPRVLALQARVGAQLADWDVAIPAAEECRRLATELGERYWVAAADAVESIIAGMRGDEEGSERAAQVAERVVTRTGSNITAAYAQFGRVQAALGAGKYDDAYAAAEPFFDPASQSHHPVVACWIGDLAEAALRSGRVAEARTRLVEVEAAAGEVAGTCTALGLLHARALLAEDDEVASDSFDEAFRTDFSGWPFQRARLLLAYGQWLRRQRRIADSRAYLRDARDVFDALGCAAWSDQARRDLRASGESSVRRNPIARDQLTAQELQIAQFAAQGLSNREIGQRLYLSPRTVGTHLYHIFPKLQITDRSELARALSVQPAPTAPR
jgi:DNA-binding CsgD family transcriptional regulator